MNPLILALLASGVAVAVWIATTKRKTGNGNGIPPGTEITQAEAEAIGLAFAGTIFVAEDATAVRVTQVVFRDGHWLIEVELFFFIDQSIGHVVVQISTLGTVTSHTFGVIP